MGGSILLLINLPLQPDPLLPASPRLGIFNATGRGRRGIFFIDVSAEVSGEKWQMQIVSDKHSWCRLVVVKKAFRWWGVKNAIRGYLPIFISFDDLLWSCLSSRGTIDLWVRNTLTLGILVIFGNERNCWQYTLTDLLRSEGGHCCLGSLIIEELLNIFSFKSSNLVSDVLVSQQSWEEKISMNICSANDPWEYLVVVVGSIQRVRGNRIDGNKHLLFQWESEKYKCHTQRNVNDNIWEIHFSSWKGFGGVGEEVISIYCSGDGASDPVQGALGKTKYKVQNINTKQNLIWKRDEILECRKIHSFNDFFFAEIWIYVYTHNI